MSSTTASCETEQPTREAGGSETGGAYSLLQFTAPVGSPWSTHHVHPATEAWYVLDGELTFRLGETIRPAPAGTFVLAPGGLPHSQVNSGRVPAEYLVIFSPGGGAVLRGAEPPGREHRIRPARP